MNLDPNDPLEQQLAAQPQAALPAELRPTVMKAVHGQLAGQRWERRLGRFTMAVLALGIGLNWAAGWHDQDWIRKQSEIASHPSVNLNSNSIIEVAVAIGQATDAETASRMAQHLTALNGTTLSPQQAAAMEQEIQRRIKTGALGRKEG